jgi:hypothetical protein
MLDDAPARCSASVMRSSRYGGWIGAQTQQSLKIPPPYGGLAMTIRSSSKVSVNLWVNLLFFSLWTGED